MKTTLRSILLGLSTLLAATFALADGALVASLTGTATVQSGSIDPKPLRLGDSVREGDTVATGPNSTAVLKFDDGQVTALSQRSKLTIATYKYDANTKTGSMLLSLVDGGMRAITGLMGKANPQSNVFQARTATIGVRGTDFLSSIVDYVGQDGVTRQQVFFTVKSGQINVSTKAGSSLLGQGQSVVMMPSGAITPVPPAALPPDLQSLSATDLSPVTGQPPSAGNPPSEAAPGTVTGNGVAGSAGGAGGSGGGGSPAPPTASRS